MTAKPTARIFRGTPRNLRFLAKILRTGGLVAVPTETVYGLAANALDPAACRRIFRAKGRPASDPLIVHIHAAKDLAGVSVPNEAAWILARKFWPGPLTLVLPKRDIIPTVVSAGLPSVAVRMPQHRLFRRLLKLSGLPLAAPSANPFGYISPTSAAHVHAGLGRKISYILEGGQSPIGVESTIVDLRDPAAPRLLRPGAITRAQIEQALGVRVLGAHKQADDCAQIAPGRLARHYSPLTPAVLHDRISPRAILRGPKTEAWIFTAKPPRRILAPNVFWLDPKGSLRGAAQRLFATLRRVDSAGFTKIHFERASGGGLAEAINDRLARAASRG